MMVFEFVIKNFSFEITVAEMGEPSKPDRKFFLTLLQQSHTHNFHHVCKRSAPESCRKLLSEDQMNISEVCFECGFNNLSNFNRQFKNVYRISIDLPETVSG